MSCTYDTCSLLRVSTFSFHALFFTPPVNGFVDDTLLCAVCVTRQSGIGSLRLVQFVMHMTPPPPCEARRRIKMLATWGAVDQKQWAAVSRALSKTGRRTYLRRCHGSQAAVVITAVHRDSISCRCRNPWTALWTVAWNCSGCVVSAFHSLVTWNSVVSDLAFDEHCINSTDKIGEQ